MPQYLPTDIILIILRLLHKDGHYMALRRISKRYRNEINTALEQPDFIWQVLNELPPRQINGFVQFYLNSEAYIKLSSRDRKSLLPMEALCLCLGEVTPRHTFWSYESFFSVLHLFNHPEFLKPETVFKMICQLPPVMATYFARDWSEYTDSDFPYFSASSDPFLFLCYALCVNTENIQLDLQRWRAAISEISLKYPDDRHIQACLHNLILSSIILDPESSLELKIAALHDRSRNAYMNLQGANLKGARLENLDLSGVNLGHAILTDAQVINTSLRGSHIFWTEMQNSFLRKVNLQAANMRFASLKGALLTDINFSFAIMQSTNMDNIIVFTPDETPESMAAKLDYYNQKGFPDDARAAFARNLVHVLSTNENPSLMIRLAMNHPFFKASADSIRFFSGGESVSQRLLIDAVASLSSRFIPNCIVA